VSLSVWQEHRVRDLERLYTLLGRVGGLGAIKTGFGALVRRVGTEMVLNEERSSEMVQVSHRELSLSLSLPQRGELLAQLLEVCTASSLSL
jgi:hypothetical protein